MTEIYTLRVQNFGKRLVYALCNHEDRDLCTVPHAYITGRLPPNYPVPAKQYEHRGFWFIDHPEWLEGYKHD